MCNTFWDVGKREEQVGLETVEIPDILRNREEMFCHVYQPMPSELKENLRP